MKILVIGLGSIGVRHLKNFKIIFPDADIYSLRSGNTSSGMQQKILLDKTIPQYSVINKLSEVRNLAPDYVVICTPSYLHAQNILDIHNNTNAVILVEKPSAIDLDQVRALNNIENSGRVFVAQQLRFHPISSFLKNILIKKTLGECYRFRMVHSEHLSLWHPWENYKNSYSANKAMGGGSLLTQNHELDLAEYLFGIPRRQISIIGSGSHLEIDCDEMCNQILHYCFLGKQLIGEISNDLLGKPPKKNGEFHFEGGSIYVDFILNKVISNILEDYSDTNFQYQEIEFDRNDPYLSMVQALSKVNQGIVDNRLVPLAESLYMTKRMINSKTY